MVLGKQETIRRRNVIIVLFMFFVSKMRKFIKFVTGAAVIVSVIFDVAAEPLPKPRMWPCYQTVCTENTGFCDADSRRCQLCEDYKQYCSTNLQPQNCTHYCMKIGIEKNLEELNLKKEEERKAGCDIPEHIPNGSFNTSGQQPYRSTAQFYCKEGYKSDSREIVCGDFGKWYPQPECVAIVCPAPNLPRNANTEPEIDKQYDSVHIQLRGPEYGTDYRVGQKFRIRCEDNYHLKGSATITCGMDGHWEPFPFPACYPESDGLVWKISFLILISIYSISLISLGGGLICLRMKKRNRHIKGHNYQSDQDSHSSMRSPGNLDDQDEDAERLLERRSDNRKDETELKRARCSCTKSRQRRASYTDDDDSQPPTVSPPANGAATPGPTANGAATSGPTANGAATPVINNNINIQIGAPCATANATANMTVNNGTSNATNRDNENEGNLYNNERNDPYAHQETGDGDNQQPACRPEGHNPIGFPPSSELPEIKRNLTETRQPHDNDSLRADKMGFDDRTFDLDDMIIH